MRRLTGALDDLERAFASLPSSDTLHPAAARLFSAQTSLYSSAADAYARATDCATINASEAAVDATKNSFQLMLRQMEAERDRDTENGNPVRSELDTFNAKTDRQVENAQALDRAVALATRLADDFLSRARDAELQAPHVDMD
jgi:hypothetical protein